MHISKLAVSGAALLSLNPLRDDRGFFARAWDAELLIEHGLDPTVAQMNLSANNQAGTLRGLHYQQAPHGEAKLFRCLVGRTYHVCVDMRPQSPTYLQWCSAELTASGFDAIYMPAGCAAGYQALTDGATVLYTASTRYAPAAERGVRWDDPALGIDWPLAGVTRDHDLVSPKDAAWPLLTDPATAPTEGAAL